MAQRAYRIDNAETGITSAPTAAPASEASAITLDGIDKKASRTHLHLRKGAASGTRTARVKVHGYLPALLDADKVPLGSSAGWQEIFDTGELSEAADFNRSWMLRGAQDFAALATEVVTNGGTTPTLTTAIGFEANDAPG